MADGSIARLPRAQAAKKGLRNIQKIDRRLWCCFVEGFMHKAQQLRLDRTCTSRLRGLPFNGDGLLACFQCVAVICVADTLQEAAS
jgi:hypothetical protein